MMTIKTSHNDKCNVRELLEFETISYWANQLKSSQVKNMEKDFYHGTRYAYLSNACVFHNWLVGRDFTFKNTIQTGVSTFEVKENTIQLEGLEHFLKLYQNSYNSESHFIKLIKKYLMCDVHEGKKSSSMVIVMSAIKSYFEKNESPITFSFDPDTNYDNTKSSMEQTSLSLDEIFMMLTRGKPNIMEHALILCKFHRGLDNLTFADSFNYEAWSQLVNYFGTEEYQKWDTKKCPVPIKLIRVKTQYLHTGFLDVDAIDSLKIYLKLRYDLTGTSMSDGAALFITSSRKPVSNKHVYRIVRTLLKNAGLEEQLKNYSLVNKYKKNSHEFRDTLKSTLIASGCRLDIADHVIGHSPKDSYEKQTELYPEQMREEFAKVSKKLNMFTNMSDNIQGSSEKEVIEANHKKQMDKLSEELKIQQSQMKIQQMQIEKLMQENTMISTLQHSDQKPKYR